MVDQWFIHPEGMNLFGVNETDGKGKNWNGLRPQEVG